MSKTKDQKNKLENIENENKVGTSQIDTLSFEDCLNKVEMLSNELESGGLVLNDALQKYKLAMAIMDRASSLLTVAKDELQVIDRAGEKTVSKQEILNK